MDEDFFVCYCHVCKKKDYAWMNFEKFLSKTAVVLCVAINFFDWDFW